MAVGVLCIQSSSYSTSISDSQQSLPLQSDLHKQKSMNPRTGRLDRVFVNLEAVYPDLSNPQSELDFESLRAKKRGWLDVDWAQERKKSKTTTTSAPRNTEKESLVDDSFEGSQTRSVQGDDSTDQTGVLHDNSDTSTGKDPRHHKSRKLKVVEVKSKPQTSTYWPTMSLEEKLTRHSTNKARVSYRTEDQTKGLCRTHNDFSHSGCHRGNLWYL
jgi:checkpoint serine/threonine-protein kinase